MAKRTPEEIRKYKAKWYQEHKIDSLKKQAKKYQENKEYILKRQAIYRSKNKSKIAEADRKFRQENSEMVKRRKREYYHRVKNRDREKWREKRALKADQRNARNRISSAIYRERFPERIKQSRKKWHQNHPEKARIYGATRYARQKGAKIGSIAAMAAWRKSWKAKKSAKCFWCQERKRTKDCHDDHITPISKGGDHSIENLCICCNTCNWRKNAKLPSEWNKTLRNPVLI